MKRIPLSRKVAAAVIRYDREAYLREKAAEHEELAKFWCEMEAIYGHQRSNS